MSHASSHTLITHQESICFLPVWMKRCDHHRVGDHIWIRQRQEVTPRPSCTVQERALQNTSACCDTFIYIFDSIKHLLKAQRLFILQHHSVLWIPNLEFHCFTLRTMLNWAADQRPVRCDDGRRPVLLALVHKVLSHRKAFKSNLTLSRLATRSPDGPPPPAVRQLKFKLSHHWIH